MPMAKIVKRIIKKIADPSYTILPSFSFACPRRISVPRKINNTGHNLNTMPYDIILVKTRNINKIPKKISPDPRVKVPTLRILILLLLAVCLLFHTFCFVCLYGGKLKSVIIIIRGILNFRSRHSIHTIICSG